MAFEFENVGGSTNTRSKRRPVRRASVIHAITSPRSKVCSSPSNPLAAMLRCAQSRYVCDRSTVAVLFAPPPAACTLAVPV